MPEADASMCPQCGAPVVADASFCIKCGSAIALGAPPAGAAAVAPPYRSPGQPVVVRPEWTTKGRDRRRRDPRDSHRERRSGNAWRLWGRGGRNGVADGDRTTYPDRRTDADGEAYSDGGADTGTAHARADAPPDACANPGSHARGPHVRWRTTWWLVSTSNQGHIAPDHPARSAIGSASAGSAARSTRSSRTAPARASSQ